MARKQDSLVSNCTTASLLTAILLLASFSDAAQAQSSHTATKSGSAELLYATYLGGPGGESPTVGSR
ncbi:MAG: hypothetical protein ACC655_02440, partial [Rhodothermia bacterium]